METQNRTWLSHSLFSARCFCKWALLGLAMGGVVGLNEGRITDCTLSGSMGSATQDYIGGIAGLNVGGRAAGTVGMMEMVMGVMSEQGRLKIVWQKL